MIIDKLIFLFNIIIVVCANDGQVATKHNVSILFKRNIVDKGNNQISKLRLILMSDLRKQNEMVSVFSLFNLLSIEMITF